MWHHPITPAALAVLLVAGPAPAAEQHTEPCTVVAVRDGDTLTADCAGQRLAVRLREIDAPERKQPYSRRSTDSLKHLCLGRPATLEQRGLDKYGRTLARVTCGRVDVNAEQVRRGYAWAFRQYLTDPAIAELEATARSERRGLWRSEDPVAPWIFRHPLPAGTP